MKQSECFTSHQRGTRGTNLQGEHPANHPGRRDTDRQGSALGVAIGNDKLAQEIPFSRALGSLDHELEMQVQTLEVLIARLSPVLEPATPSGGESASDPCPYSGAGLIHAVAARAQRLQNNNAVLLDLIQRLAI